MNVTYNAKRGTVGNFRSSKPRKPLPSSIFDDDIVEDELGTETEAEKHMKLLLQKQLKTNISLEEHFKQHKAFTSPSTYTPLTELVKGACSLEQFKETEKDEEDHQDLQQCGLSEDEIHLYLTFKNRMAHSNKIEPSIWKEKIDIIKEKIAAHHKDLSKPQVFSDVKQLSRHEMDLEKTLYAGCENKNMLSPLVSAMQDGDFSASDNVFNHIKSLSQKLLQKCRKSKKRKNSLCELSHDFESFETCDNLLNFEYNPNVHHVIVPLEETEIEKNRISVDEIRKLARFENYEAGEPSKVLYIQNLHPKINIQELQALFIRFEEENLAPLEYRLMAGRMRGQAFITFSDSKLAQKALNSTTGYMLRQKPVIIKFGKRS